MDFCWCGCGARFNGSRDILGLIELELVTFCHTFVLSKSGDFTQWKIHCLWATLGGFWPLTAKYPQTKMSNKTSTSTVVHLYQPLPNKL